LIFNKTVNVKEINIDRYGRTIGLVHIGSINVNEKLLSEGLAWHYLKYDKSKKWDMLEEKARRKKIGLWANPKAIAPWVYRQSKRNIH